MINEQSILQAVTPATAFGFPTNGRSSRPVGDRNGAANLFLAQFDGTLRRLRANRLRFSVMRLILPPEVAGDATVAARVTRHMADPHIMSGLWRDCSVVGAFFGPRSSGRLGDELQTRTIVQRCWRAMNGAGEPDLIPLSQLLVAHCWTDEVLDPAALIEALGTPDRWSA